MIEQLSADLVDFEEKFVLNCNPRLGLFDLVVKSKQSKGSIMELVVAHLVLGSGKNRMQCTHSFIH